MSIEHPRTLGEPTAPPDFTAPTARPFTPVPSGESASSPAVASAGAPDAPATLPLRPSPHSGWRSLLFLAGRAVRLLLIAFGLWLFAVLVAILLYSKVDPPFTTLTAAARISGRTVQQVWVPLEQISPALVRAVILSEDTGFCRHSGVSLGEIEKALEQAKDGVPRGGSTISMQLTKNLFLWPQRSYVRKALEIPLTLAMEQVLSKRRILEIYLNVAQLGPNVFGAEAAARYHFKKSAARLVEQEAALLTATLPAPGTRRPSRPNSVLQRLGHNLEARMKAAGARAAACVLQ